MWLVLPLAVGAGLDLYLTLFLLGVAPTLPWWSHPLPGALGDLNALPVVGVVGVMYVLEAWAERRPSSSLLWNATHALIRPVSGALLIALLLHGSDPVVLVAGAVAGGAITSLTHAVRSGDAILRRLDPGPDPDPRLLSAFEDVVVLGLVAASLDAPRPALGAAGAVALMGIPLARSRVRAFVFATRLTAARVFQTFRQRRWTPTERLPRWVRAALDDDILAPGGGLRGARAGVLGMRGFARFTTGWLVVRGDRPVFVHGPEGGVGRLAELNALTPTDVADEEFHRRVDLLDEEGRPVRILFFVTGPSSAALAAEFGIPVPRATAAGGQKNL